uniref:Uncharacterized protein n=1 Tax=mine drainage metagenome TaxID=410659 RepID=E6PTP2_9ZZZZ
MANDVLWLCTRKIVVSQERDEWRAVLIVSKISANDPMPPAMAGLHLYNSTLIRLCWIGVEQDQYLERGCSFSASASETR